MKLKGLTPAELNARAEELVDAELTAQGLPLVDTDPVRLARLAALLDRSDRRRGSGAA